MGTLLEYIWEISNSVETDYKNLPLLPVIIGYDAIEAANIAEQINSNKIKMKQVHAGYGRHSDSIGINSLARNLDEFEWYCPILLVNNIQKIGRKHIKEIYPFSIEDYKEESICKDGPEVERFSLGNHDENILKYIECIFGSNEAYLYGQLKKTDSKSRVISVIEHLYDKSNNPKLKTIYVDIEYVRLIDENLECIILPERLLAFEEFKSFSKYSDSKYSGVTIIEYKTNPTHHPAWYNGVVSDLLEGYLREKGKV